MADANGTEHLHLSPPQAEVLASCLLSSGFNCVLQMPTGSGKTWLAENAIRTTLERGGRAVYLTPLRALAAELVEKWQHEFAPFKVGVFTGDYGINNRPFPISFRNAQLLVMTPERLDVCTRGWRSHWSWLPEVDLIVVDELHLLGDPRRGARLEGALSRARRLNPFARIIGLSATLGNRAELAKWLDGVEYGSNWRSVPIDWRFIRYSNACDKLHLLIKEVNRNLDCGGKSLVFVQSRRRAEELSRSLQSQHLRASHHHAGLDHRSRSEVERDFRNHQIDVLVATSTLEMGINLPVRQVVLYDVQAFDGYDFRPLTTNSVWQRVGRAGRRGLDPSGEAVLIIPRWDRAAEKYTRGAFEPIRSALSDTGALAEQIVVEVASGLSRTPRQLAATFSGSLAARQRSLPSVESVILEMREAGMIADSHDADDTQERSAPPVLRATRLGRIAARHLLAPATISLFRRVCERHAKLTFFDLFLLAACTDDCEPLLPVDFEGLDALADSLAKERSILLQLSRAEVARLLGADGKRLLASIKTALVAREWTRVGDASQVADEQDCYSFEVERLRESLERLLTAMYAIFAVSDQGEAASAHVVENTLLRELVGAARAMISGGLDEFGVTLTLVEGIGTKTAQRFLGEGIADIEQLARLCASDFPRLKGITTKRLTQWVDEAKRLALTNSAFTFHETAPLVNAAPTGWLPGVDPYRLRRALDLRVASADGGTLLVTGGLEPHVVRLHAGDPTCDCVDAARGNLCKHALAVRMHMGDEQLKLIADKLGRTVGGEDRIDVFELWSDVRSQITSRVS
jgi:helicase